MSRQLSKSAPAHCHSQIHVIYFYDTHFQLLGVPHKDHKQIVFEPYLAYKQSEDPVQCSKIKMVINAFAAE